MIINRVYTLGLIPVLCFLISLPSQAQNPYANEKTINGVSIFEEDGKTGLKNKEGKVIFKPKKMLVIHHIGHGFTLLREINSKNKTETYSVLDPAGKLICGPAVEPTNGGHTNSTTFLSYFFVNGVIEYFPACKKSTEFRVGLMDMNSKKLTPAIYGEIDILLSDSADLILVRKSIFEGGQFGYIDYKGQEIIQPAYRQATHFSNDSKHALVKNTQWQVINHTGEVVFTPKHNLLIKENQSYDCYGGIKCYDKEAMKRNGNFVMLDASSRYHLMNINGVDKEITQVEYDNFILGKSGADYKRKIEAEVEANAKAYAENQAAQASKRGIYLLYYVARFRTELRNIDYRGGANVEEGVHCQSVCVEIPHGSDAKSIAKMVWGEEKRFPNERSREYVLQLCNSEGDCNAQAILLDKYKSTVHVNNESWKGSDLILGTHTHDNQLRIIK